MILIKRENLSGIIEKHRDGLIEDIKKQIALWKKRLNEKKLNLLINEGEKEIQIRETIDDKKLRSLKQKLTKLRRRVWQLSNCKNLIETLDFFSDEKIKALLESPPEKLLEINRDFKKYVSNKNLNPEEKQLKKIIGNIFNYDNFSDKNKVGWNAYKLSKELDVRVCPYCNRQFTFTVIVSNDHGSEECISRPEFDHFFLKDEYPLLMLSFYNLIPSCHICNSTLKRTESFNMNSHIHPYFFEFGQDAVFKYKPTDTKGYTDDSNEIEVYLSIKEGCENELLITGNKQSFRLNEIYDMHKDHVWDLIKINNETNSKCLELIYKNIRNPDGTSIFKTREELYKLAFSNYYREEDFDKRILSKLTKDISGDLGMLNFDFIEET